MGLGIGTLLHSSWRDNHFAPDFVEVVPSNYGTTGSLAHWRDRRTDTILSPVAGADPRLRRFNGLIPAVWRLRVLDDAKIAAIESRAPGSFGAPVAFTPPRTASLLGGNVLK